MPTTTESVALDVALTYHRAWTGGDLDAAMALVADDVVYRTPNGEIVGKDAYREYLGGFMEINVGLTEIAAFGDAGRAVLFYCPHTEVTSTAPAAELFTIRDGLVVENRLVFDRLSFAPPEQ